MSLRGESVPLTDEGGKVPTHVQNKEGRIFIASPQLLKKEDMRPIFDGDPEEIKNINSNLDILKKKGPPPHVRNKEGRVFVSTPQLIARGDMEFLYGYEPDSNMVEEDGGSFVLEKATKQVIQDKAKKDFGVEISTRLTLKEMRAKFVEFLTDGNKSKEAGDESPDGYGDGANTGDQNSDSPDSLSNEGGNPVS